MLEKIMNLVKGQVTDKVDQEPGIPENKKAETVQTTASSIIDGLKDQLTSGNLSSITSLFGGKQEPETENALTENVQSSVISSLTSKVGLNSSTARNIAIAVVPAVIALLTKKVKDDKEPGFNVSSLIGSLTGNRSGSGSGKGVMEMVGSLFGKD